MFHIFTGLCFTVSSVGFRFRYFCDQQKCETTSRFGETWKPGTGWQSGQQVLYALAPTRK